ncbi:MAG: tyrosine-type recombinase/integrase [Candidatus Ratteibacteria bacterium]|nr:tyrosine-type recombinase/integrase [Candidatus Ratteibacteria bacterium]
MATLRKKNGKYFIDFRINGRRIRKIIGASKKIAELALKDVEVKIAKGEAGFEKKDENLNKLFSDFFSYSQTNHTPSTQKRYRAIVDNFKRFLAHHPFIAKISHLNPKTFEDYKKFRFDQRAQNKTINMELQTLRAVFNLAKTWGYTKENPTESVKMLKITNHIAPRFLSEEECKILLENCNEWEYPIFYTFLNTGMRKSELQNLEWTDIDLNRRKIKIAVKKGWSPKTDERQIPLNNGLFNLLKKQKEKNKKGNLVFHDGKGNPIENNRLRKRLMRLTKRSGFPDVTKLHTLRHTFASHLVMKGVDLPTVKKLMGHADIETTMIYSHLADEHIDKAVEKLEF